MITRVLGSTLFQFWDSLYILGFMGWLHYIISKNYTYNLYTFMPISKYDKRKIKYK